MHRADCLILVPEMVRQNQTIIFECAQSGRGIEEGGKISDAWEAAMILTSVDWCALISTIVLTVHIVIKYDP